MVAALPPSVLSSGAFTHLGLWASLTPGRHTIEVAVGGASVEAGLVSPTVAAVTRADRAAVRGDVWSGHALRRGGDGWWRTFPVEVEAGEGIGSAVVVRASGLVHAEGERAVEVAVRCDGVAMGTQSLVWSEAREEAWLTRYDAGVAEGAALVRWLEHDAVMASVLPARCRLTVQRADGVSESGVWREAQWSLALRWLAEGRLCALVVEDEAGTSGVSLGCSPRGDGRPYERVVWHDTRGLSSVLTTRLVHAWREASPGPGGVQWGVGVLDEVLRPRVTSAWEFARGVEALPVSARWLGRAWRGHFMAGSLVSEDGAAPTAEAWAREELLGIGRPSCEDRARSPLRGATRRATRTV